MPFHVWHSGRVKQTAYRCEKYTKDVLLRSKQGLKQNHPDTQLSSTVRKPRRWLYVYAYADRYRELLSLTNFFIMSYPTQVRVFEIVNVLQTIAEYTIHACMGK